MADDTKFIIIFFFFLFRNEADVGRGVKKAGLKREDVFVVSKIWDANGYDYCKKLFNKALKKFVLFLRACFKPKQSECVE